MERLTKRWGAQPYPNLAGKVICEYKECGSTRGCENCIHGRYKDRLAAIEDILGDEYDLDELREMVQAKRKGRCIVLPCKKGDTVWRIVHDAAPHITKDRCTDIKYENRDIWVHLIGDRVMGGWNFGKLLFLTREDAEAALRREQK